ERCALAQLAAILASLTGRGLGRARGGSAWPAAGVGDLASDSVHVITISRCDLQAVGCSQFRVTAIPAPPHRVRPPIAYRYHPANPRFRSRIPPPRRVNFLRQPAQPDQPARSALW